MNVFATILAYALFVGIAVGGFVVVIVACVRAYQWLTARGRSVVAASCLIAIYSLVLMCGGWAVVAVYWLGKWVRGALVTPRLRGSSSG